MLQLLLGGWLLLLHMVRKTLVLHLWAAEAAQGAAVTGGHSCVALMLWGLSAETGQAAGAAHTGAVLCATAGRNLDLLNTKGMLVAMQHILERPEAD